MSDTRADTTTSDTEDDDADPDISIIFDDDGNPHISTRLDVADLHAGLLNALDEVYNMTLAYVRGRPN